METTETIQ